MSQQTLPFERAHQTLSKIEENMLVYDKNGKRIGAVKDVQYASASSDILSKTLEFFRLPLEIQMYLMRYGYIQIDRGVMEHDCFATPDEVIEFRGSKLRLSKLSDDLITTA